MNLGPHPKQIGRIVPDQNGKPSETEFRVVASANEKHLIEARPYTGRTHQIRVHLAESGCPIIGDELYGNPEDAMALRAVGLAYRDPFTRKPVVIRAEFAEFLKLTEFSQRTIASSFIRCREVRRRSRQSSVSL